MKKKIILVLIIIFNLIPINIYAISTEQQAIQEIANAYYQRGINAQYSSERSSRVFTPEEATNQNTTYSMCSGYTFDIYYQTFGIKLPVGTARLIAYGEKFYNKTSDVIEFWQKEIDENGNIITDENGEKIYKDNENNIKDIDLSTEEGRKKYGQKLLTELNLQIGDIICYHNGIKKDNAGHTMIVYDIIYDETGKPIDAIIRESTSKWDQKTTKISLGLSYGNQYNEKNNIFEGEYKERSLISEYKTNENTIRNPVLYSADAKQTFTILRPLQEDENGKFYYHATMTYDGITGIAGYKNIGHTRQKYEITPNALKRIEYSGIYIEKTVDKFNNSVVNLGDTLEYKIRIKNNSNEDYKSFDVIENISDYVIALEYKNGSINNNNIIWNINGLKKNEEIEIKYKVKVKEDITLLSKEIISTGTVASIPSSTIKNKIGNNLNNSQKYKIKTLAATLFSTNQYKKEQLIEKIYNDSIGISIGLNNLDITTLIKTTTATTAKSIEVDDNNEFKNRIINGYYGAVYTDDKTVGLRGWLKETITKNLETNEEIRSERATNIYEENFQTGDILIYKNTQTSKPKVTYKTEDDIYYLIYISKKDKITIKDKEIYGFIGINENGELNNLYRNESEYETDTDYSPNDLRTLLGKDLYVILRPSLSLKNDFIKGDMNKDGTINFGDVIMALRKYLNIDESTEEDIKIGDMNNTGKIEFGDIITILRIYLGIN